MGAEAYGKMAPEDIGAAPIEHTHDLDDFELDLSGYAPIDHDHNFQLELPPRSYTHNQGQPSDAWYIVHNLGYSPSAWHVEDSGGTDHDPADIENIDLNTTILHFHSPFGGTARGS